MDDKKPQKRLIVWLWMAFEKPSTHPLISDEEKIYIESSIGDAQGGLPSISSIPWIKMVMCLPVWADTIANFARIWTNAMFVVLLPQYFNEVFAMQVNSGSSLSMLPHFITAFMLPLGGRLADLVLEKKLLSVTNVRKLFNCGGDDAGGADVH